MIIDLEAGTMLDRYLGTKGYSAYLRFSFDVSFSDHRGSFRKAKRCAHALRQSGLRRFTSLRFRLGTPDPYVPKKK